MLMFRLSIFQLRLAASSIELTVINDLVVLISIDLLIGYRLVIDPTQWLAAVMNAWHFRLPFYISARKDKVPGTVKLRTSQ